MGHAEADRVETSLPLSSAAALLPPSSCSSPGATAEGVLPASEHHCMGTSGGATCRIPCNSSYCNQISARRRWAAAFIR